MVEPDGGCRRRPDRLRAGVSGRTDCAVVGAAGHRGVNRDLPWARVSAKLPAAQAQTVDEVSQAVVANSAGDSPQVVAGGSEKRVNRRSSEDQRGRQPGARVAVVRRGAGNRIRARYDRDVLRDRNLECERPQQNDHPGALFGAAAVTECQLGPERQRVYLGPLSHPAAGPAVHRGNPG